MAVVDLAEDAWITPVTPEASDDRCGSSEGIATGGWEELEDVPISVSLFTTVIVGIDDSSNCITGIAEPGSGVTDLEDLCSLDEEAPRNAAAVDVDVNAALRVLNAGGPVVLLRQAAWFSSLTGRFGTGLAGGGGVRLREIDQDLRPGVRESWEPTLACFGAGLTERFDEGDEERIEEVEA